MEYIRSLQRSTSKQHLKEERTPERNEEEVESITDSTDENVLSEEFVDKKYIDIDYIDEVQLKVKKLSIE